VEDFNKLRQVGSVEDYLEKFEELKSFMLQKNPANYPDEFFIDSFIGGLKPQLKPFVKPLIPHTQGDDVGFVRLQKVVEA